MKLRLLLLSALLAISFNTPTMAQGENPLMPSFERAPIYIGPVIGFNRSLHSVTLQPFPQSIDDEGNLLCNPFENGTDNGFFVGLSWEYLLGDVETSNSSIIVRGLYNTFPSTLEAGGDSFPSLATVEGQNGGQQIINSSTEYINEVNYNVFTIEAMYKLNPFPGLPLGFAVGPTFDFAMVREQNQMMNLVEPNNAYFSNYNPETQTSTDGNVYTNDGRTMVIREGEIDESSAFRFGLKAGVQYEILTSGKLYIVPGLFYNLGITNLSGQEDWRVDALQMGVDFRYAF